MYYENYNTTEGERVKQPSKAAMELSGQKIKWLPLQQGTFSSVHTFIICIYACLFSARNWVKVNIE